MARHKDEAEEIVPNLVVDGRVQIHAFHSPLDIASDLLVLALERLTAPDEVDRAVLRGPHEPGARAVGHAFGGPLLERRDEGVLSEFLGGPDVADDTSQPGDEPCRLDPPDRFDRTMRFGGCCLAAIWPGRRVSPSRTYGESSFTCPRTRRPHGSRTSRRRRVPASATPGPRRSSAPATANSRLPALWSLRTARR